MEQRGAVNATIVYEKEMRLGQKRKSLPIYFQQDMRKKIGLTGLGHDVHDTERVRLKMRKTSLLFSAG